MPAHTQSYHLKRLGKCTISPKAGCPVFSRVRKTRAKVRNLASVRVKANAKYICQECGSTELIQAHHETPGDDNTLAVLCADCHSRKHPDIPRALLFNKRLQPYWHNKSASSLAKELGVHPRTIIRAAQRLEILPGDNLSPWDEELIRNNIPKLKWKAKAKKAKKPRFPKTCDRCGYSWNAFKPDPMYCPDCGYWVHPVSTTPSPTEFTIKIEGVVTPSDAAQQLNESERTIYRWAEKGKIITIRLGGILFVPKSEVERLQKEKATVVNQ